MNLTPRQLDVLVAIRVYRQQHGISINLQEIADALGTSKVTAYAHVIALEKKDVIRRSRYKARSIEIIGEDGESALSLAIEKAVTELRGFGSLATAEHLERMAAIGGAS